MMKNKDFTVFILTHGRPDNVITYNTLKKAGYTGKVYIVIDNEDKTAEQYKKRFGKKVVVFDKKAIAETFDEADNFDDRRAIIYARNATFKIAKDLGITYFMQLDDDYTSFDYRFNHNLEYWAKPIHKLDSIIDSMLEMYKNTTIDSIAMAQGGDFIGGQNGSLAKNPVMKRKCMNTFICSTLRPFQFVGRINEDVNTYTSVASRGKVFLTIPLISITQKTTQSNSGGMTDIYLDNGTYIKSFYTIIFSPSCTKIALMGSKHKRLHHRVSWNNAVPKILSESVRQYA